MPRAPSREEPRPGPPTSKQGSALRPPSPPDATSGGRLVALSPARDPRAHRPRRGPSPRAPGASPQSRPRGRRSRRGSRGLPLQGRPPGSPCGAGKRFPPARRALPRAPGCLCPGRREGACGAATRARPRLPARLSPAPAHPRKAGAGAAPRALAAEDRGPGARASFLSQAGDPGRGRDAQDFGQRRRGSAGRRREALDSLPEKRPPRPSAVPEQLRSPSHHEPVSCSALGAPLLVVS